MALIPSPRTNEGKERVHSFPQAGLLSKLRPALSHVFALGLSLGSLAACIPSQEINSPQDLKPVEPVDPDLERHRALVKAKMAEVQAWVDNIQEGIDKIADPEIKSELAYFQHKFVACQEDLANMQDETSYHYGKESATDSLDVICDYGHQPYSQLLSEYQTYQRELESNPSTLNADWVLTEAITKDLEDLKIFETTLNNALEHIALAITHSRLKMEPDQIDQLHEIQYNLFEAKSHLSFAKQALYSHISHDRSGSKEASVLSLGQFVEKFNEASAEYEEVRQVPFLSMAIHLYIQSKGEIPLPPVSLAGRSALKPKSWSLN